MDSIEMNILLATTPSDSHTWNLIYLKMLLEEHNHQVNLLGPCTPVDDIISGVQLNNVDIVAISSINGHGFLEAQEIPQKMCRLPHPPPIIIGGNLITNGRLSRKQKNHLIRIGFYEVYSEGDSTSEFICDLKTIQNSNKLVNFKYK
jgi:methylaspartate mutase sigma subunit